MSTSFAVPESQEGSAVQTDVPSFQITSLSSSPTLPSSQSPRTRPHIHKRSHRPGELDFDAEADVNDLQTPVKDTKSEIIVIDEESEKQSSSTPLNNAEKVSRRFEDDFESFLVSFDDEKLAAEEHDQEDYAEFSVEDEDQAAKKALSSTPVEVLLARAKKIHSDDEFKRLSDPVALEHKALILTKVGRAYYGAKPNPTADATTSETSDRKKQRVTP